MKSITMKRFVASASLLGLPATAACSGADMPDGAEDFGPESNVRTVQSALRSITAQQNLTYSGTLNAAASACNSPRGLAVFEPTDAAPGEKFPVFILAGGLFANQLAPDSIEIAKAAARRGYVAASMDFASDQIGTCTTLDQRADCSYNGTRSNSAVKVLCNRPLADCSRGIVLGGGSLGGALAVRAKNFEPRVRAIFTVGTANGNGTGPCVERGPLDGGSTNRVLRNREWRLYAGDTEFIANSAANRNLVTGQSCAGGEGTINCLRPDGSGWFQVGDAEVPDGIADHCYTSNGNGPFAGLGAFIGENPNVVQSCGSGQVNSVFLNEQRPWSVGPTIDFLTSRIDPQGCDQGFNGLDQLNAGRLQLTFGPFFSGTFLSVATVTGSPSSTVAAIVTTQNPQTNFDAIITVLLTLQTLPVSLASTAPNVFQLCQAINFPVSFSCNAQNVCTRL
jgi:hypothetical protein